MAKVRVPLSMVLAGWAWRRAVGISLVLPAPHAVAAFVALLALWRVTADHGPLPLMAGISCVIAGLVALRLWAPEHFTRWVAWRAKGWWRSARVPLRMAAGHGDHHFVRVDGEEYLQDRLGPQLGHRRPGARPHAARAGSGGLGRQRTPAGPDVRARSAASGPLCRRRRDLELWFLVDDPLTAEVRRSPWRRLIRGGSRRDARGRADLSTRLLGTHLLVVGARPVPKGSVLWSIIAARLGHSGPDGAGLGARPEGRDGAGRGSTAVRTVRIRRPQRRHGLRGRLRPRSGGRGLDHAPPAGTVARGVSAAHPDPARNR